MTTEAPVKYTTITVAEFLDAMEKNGFEQITGDLYRKEDLNSEGWLKDPETVTHACALGQAMLNLGAQSVVHTTAAFRDLVKRVSYLNDVERLPPDEIAKIVREEFVHLLNTEIMVYPHGSDEKFYGGYNGR